MHGIGTSLAGGMKAKTLRQCYQSHNHNLMLFNNLTLIYLRMYNFNALVECVAISELR